MQLKGRLKLIADKTPKCNILSDIGTDHAYIPIYLVKNNRCCKAIAADIKEGPLKSARENINENGLPDIIETRLGDGLDPISVEESDVIIIAGMGGTLITEILQRGIGQAKHANTLVLQPMSDIEATREWLYKNQFDIYDEELVNEGEKIYNVICARYVGENRNIGEIYYYIGEKLIEERDPLLSRVLDRKLGLLEKAVEEMKKAGAASDKIKYKYNWLISELRRIKSDLGNP